MSILFCKIYIFLKTLTMFIDTKINSKNLRNMRILLFLLKVASYKAKRSCIVMLT
jgi:hypothetical protein